MKNISTKSTSTNKIYDLNIVSLSSLEEEWKRDFPKYKVIKRELLGLLDEYVEWLRAGNKTTTIRYRKGSLSAPANKILPLYNTGSLSAPANTYIGKIRIKKIDVKSFGDLDDINGLQDGFKNRKELREALQNIYGKIRDDEIVTIFHIELVA